MYVGTLICIIALHLVTVIGRCLDPLEEPAANYCARKDLLERQGTNRRAERLLILRSDAETQAAFDQELRKLQSLNHV